MSHDKIKDAEKVIQFIARFNGHNHVDMDSLKRMTETEKKEENESHIDRKYTLLDVFKNKSLLKLALLLVWIWYDITKICLYKYSENFTIKKWKFLDENGYCFHFPVLTRTHNLCFKQK